MTIDSSATDNRISLERSIDEMKHGDYKSFKSVDDLFNDLENDVND